MTSCQRQVFIKVWKLFSRFPLQSFGFLKKKTKRISNTIGARASHIDICNPSEQSQNFGHPHDI